MPEGQDVTRTGQVRSERRPFDWSKDAPELKERSVSELSRALGDTATLHDIAELTGHTYANLQNWSKRDDDFFPKPIPGSGNVGPTGAVSGIRYSLSEITEWDDNFEPLKTGRPLGSGQGKVHGPPEPPKPYDPATDVGRKLSARMEAFQSGGINPNFKWPTVPATREEAPGWHGIHGGATPRVPAKTAEPRPVDTTPKPTEAPESEERKAEKAQRRKIEDNLKESKKIDEGRDVEGRPGKKFW